MRIALVSPYDPLPTRALQGTAAHKAEVGGVERVYAQLACGLARRGHDVTLVCSSREAAGRRRERGLTVVRRRRLATVWRAPLAHLAQAVPDDCDVVQVAATYPFTTAPVLRRAHRRGAATVLDFHFEPVPASALGRLAGRAYRLTGPRAYALADAVLVRSIAYARTAPSLSRVRPARWHTIPNGVDTEAFTADGPSPQRSDLLFVGRLVPYKGLEILLQAMARMHGQHRLLVAGDGPMRKPLERQADRLGVDARFLGHVPDGDLPGLYRGATVTVLPSLNGQEAFGIALLESMACGTPVVASDLPGVSDLARLGGLVARPGHADDLARKLQRALEPGSLRRGRALADPIRLAYSWDAVTDRVVEAYAEALASRTAAQQEVSPRAHPRRNPVL